jgi:hypothetical protein
MKVRTQSSSRAARGAIHPRLERQLEHDLRVEKPDIFVDTDSAPTRRLVADADPDLGSTPVREADFGHVQFSTCSETLGRRTVLDKGTCFGWGVNLSAGLDLGKNDTVQLLGVYGEGVGGQGNDAGFLNSDAAFSASGDLEALPYWSATVGYTHGWNQHSGPP